MPGKIESAISKLKREKLLTDLVGICCIAHSGEGNILGKVGLENGQWRSGNLLWVLEQV